MGTFKSASLWIVIFLLFIVVLMKGYQTSPNTELTLSQFKQYLEKGHIKTAVDRGNHLEGAFRDPGESLKEKQYRVRIAPNYAEPLFDMIAAAEGVEFSINHKSEMLSQLLLTLIIPVAFIIGIWLLIMRQMQGGSAKAMSFGKSKAKLVSEGQVKITFDDVAGVDEAKEELKEIVEFLKDPKKFLRLGGKIPKGVLLYGRPGTGKTLLAKAVAGEANVPFFSISGSDFVEMFVGVGASRVRDLFEQGKRAKPCLIFIDEIDAVGRHRFAGIGGGHDEREQTLNQLLVEMDGFTSNEGVILIAATNRPDVLDPALLRPGRFDRQIAVDFPDLVGREKILRVHARNVKLADQVDFGAIAKGTPGFSGADLANIINEAALLAARRNHPAVQQDDLEEAKDRVMMGPERRSMALTEREKKVTAYHEAGHALVMLKTPDSDPVHKVTIIPRGRSLGLTASLPEEDRHNETDRRLRNNLIYLLGGRAAEKIQFNEMTTGASSDISRATQLAHSMVCKFGMSDSLGPRLFGDASGELFLGREIGRERNFSEDTAAQIDREVKRLIDDAYQTAEQILLDNREMLEQIAQALIERETLTGDDLKALLEGRELPPLPVVAEPPVEPREKAEKKPEKSPPGLKPLGKIPIDQPSQQPS